MAQYTIASDPGAANSANGRRQATISSLGAELMSLIRPAEAENSEDKKNTKNIEEEYLWQGDPTIWSGRAPILFPVVGALKNGQFEFNGLRYAMPQHGFVRRREFSCEFHDQHRLQLRYQSNPESREHYPWDFVLDVEFSWRQQELLVSYRVTNTDTCDMLFNIGSHPAFRLPLGGPDGCRIEDYRMVFSSTETLDTYRLIDGLLQPDPTRFLTANNQFSLRSDLFDQDALVFMNIESRHVELQHHQSGCRVRVDTGGAPHLGIWAKPAAPYVCIEPWWGYADFADADGDLTRKSGIQTLSPGEVFVAEIGIATL